VARTSRGRLGPRDLRGLRDARLVRDPVRGAGALRGASPARAARATAEVHEGTLIPGGRGDRSRHWRSWSSHDRYRQRHDHRPRHRARGRRPLHGRPVRPRRRDEVRHYTAGAHGVLAGPGPTRRGDAARGRAALARGRQRFLRLAARRYARGGDPEPGRARGGLRRSREPRPPAGDPAPAARAGPQGRRRHRSCPAGRGAAPGRQAPRHAGAHGEAAPLRPTHLGWSHRLRPGRHPGQRRARRRLDHDRAAALMDWVQAA